MKKDYEKEMKIKVQLILYIAVFLIAIASLNDIKWLEKLVNNNISWIVISVFTTGFCQMVIQKFSGDYFEKILFKKNILGFNFSISLFLMLTIILKFLLFRDV